MQIPKTLQLAWNKISEDGKVDKNELKNLVDESNKDKKFRKTLRKISKESKNPLTKRSPNHHL